MVRVSIERPGFISLDGNTYRVKEDSQGTRQVRSRMSDQFADKIVIGDVGQDAHQEVSYLRWDNWTEGIGLEEFFSAGGPAPRRAWYSTCDLSNDKHLTLGPLVTQTAALPNTATTGNNDLRLAMVEFKNDLYIVNQSGAVTAGANVYKYDVGGDSWGSTLDALEVTGSDMAHDIVSGLVGGTDSIVYCGRSDYAHSTDGTTWTTGGKKADVLTIWDDRLWAIDDDGNAWYSVVLGTEVDIAHLPIPDEPGGVDATAAFVTDLFKGPSLSPPHEEALYAATAFGMFRYDIDNDRWIKTSMVAPSGRFVGFGATTWNADIYFPVGMALNQVIPGTTVVINPMGPDRDHGLPTANRGAIMTLAAGFNVLAAGLSVDAPDWYQNTSELDNKDAAVLTWDGLGWQVLHTITDRRVRYCLFTGASSSYRLYFAVRGTSGTTTQEVYYIPMHPQRSNPDQVQILDYATASTHETPRFKVGEDVIGIALSVTAETKNPTSGETVIIGHDINETGTYTDFPTITTAGSTEFAFPDTTTPRGTEFRSIQLQAKLARGGTTTNTSDLISLTFKFLKKQKQRVMTHEVVLDISANVGGVDARNQWVNLRTAIDKGTLVEFALRETTAAADVDRFWVQIKDYQQIIDSGTDYKGEARLLLVEPQHLNV